MYALHVHVHSANGSPSWPCIVLRKPSVLRLRYVALRPQCESALKPVNQKLFVQWL